MVHRKDSNDINIEHITQMTNYKRSAKLGQTLPFHLFIFLN